MSCTVHKEECNFNEEDIKKGVEHIRGKLNQKMIDNRLALSLFDYPIDYIFESNVTTKMNKFDSDDKCWDCTFPSSDDEQFSKLRNLIEEIEMFTFYIDYRNESTTELTCEVTPAEEGKVLVNINIRYTA